MTDPRIGILAAAMPDIMDAETCEAVMGPGVDRLDCTEEWFRTPREMAAAILAALPPDWCGHSAMIDLYFAKDRKVDREIARLRRIEEAARAVAECCAVEESWGGQESDDLCATHTALRAALEG